MKPQHTSLLSVCNNWRSAQWLPGAVLEIGYLAHDIFYPIKAGSLGKSVNFFGPRPTVEKMARKSANP